MLDCTGWKKKFAQDAIMMTAADFRLGSCQRFSVSKSGHALAIQVPKAIQQESEKECKIISDMI